MGVMGVKRKGIINASVLWGICLTVLIGTISFAPVLLRNQGRFMLDGDYFHQYLPFLLEMKRMVETGSLEWSWNSFLGDSFLGAYSYYTVFNPFAWFVILFPESMILYATFFATLLKMVAGTLGAMAYLRMFIKNEKYALIGGLLYTFSGFTLINTNFYFFQEVIGFFPVLLWGLEYLIQKNRNGVYVAVLALTSAMNFYFFVATVFLVIIYVVFRLDLLSLQGWRENWRIFCRIAFFSILGVGIASVALLPSFYAILGSDKARSSFGNSGRLFLYSLPDLLERMRVLIAPIESNTYHAFYNSSSWCSVAAHIPVFGCLFGVYWCITKRDWLRKLLLVLTVFYVIPVLNSSFHLFTSAHYSRWLYGMVLWMILATVRSLESLDSQGKTLSKKYIVVYLTVAACLTLVPAAMGMLYRLGMLPETGITAAESDYYIGNRGTFLMVVLAVGNNALLWYLIRKKRSANTVLTWICIVCAANYGLYNSLNYNVNYESHYEKTVLSKFERDNSSFQYRIDYPQKIHNYGLFYNIPAVQNYNSMQNPNSTRFALETGMIQNPSTIFLSVSQENREIQDALLSVRYFVDYERMGEIPDGFRYCYTENNTDIYENENYIPMGFTYESYVLESFLENMEAGKRAEYLMEALVISACDEAAVREILPEWTEPVRHKTLAEKTQEHRMHACSFFEGTSEGFTARIDLEKSNIVFFSVPMDDGWEIIVNGSKAQFIPVQYGLMGVFCQEGENTIEAYHKTKGVWEGTVISIVFFLIWTGTRIYQLSHKTYLESMYEKAPYRWTKRGK